MFANILLWVYCVILVISTAFPAFSYSQSISTETTKRNSTVAFVPVRESLGIAEQISRHLHSVAAWLKTLTSNELLE
ncbi:hypothetical protein RvY_01016 [Ramazzottius varieornatus]|uniref:Uncharacterized protein n=1 Tax=Ramazzottius varieornatus TaxID=947166 RepID=A0A1D1UET8_RAMVA|nr:hypothetical protein RvY_01016 [Ramazzottius varieornatus]